jgi:hypothetical protein
MSPSTVILRVFVSALPWLALLGPGQVANAQLAAAAEPEPQRDPTLAPVQSGAVRPLSPGTEVRESSGVSVMVVNGVAHVIIGSRLYARGEKWGQAHIERITETEVWLREGGKLRKQPYFSGIERRVVLTPDAQPACAPILRKTPDSSRTSVRTDMCPVGQP